MRIIAGRNRGRRLQAPRGSCTRPTSDRVREAAFNLLQHGEEAIDLTGLVVVDAFAGTGAFALEALSRGAAYAVCLDHSAQAITAIRTNADLIGETQAVTALRSDLRQPLAPPARLAACCALAFLDPPYGQNLLSPALTVLARGGWLVPNAIAVVEMGVHESFVLPADFGLVKERRYGDTRIAILRWKAL